MNSKTIKLMAMSFVTAMSCSLYLWAETKASVPYPAGYLNWTKIKKEMMTAEDPALKGKPRVYHIYANDKAVAGYKDKRFADGSVIVADFFDTQETNGVLEETARLRLAVMVKDTQRFAQTGGWGFEQFKGDSQTESTLKTNGAANCFACHSKQPSGVFTTFTQ